MSNPIRIIVLPYGHVLVGRVRYEAGPTGREVILESPAVIRRWGTSRGLGQLAAEGPQNETILDHGPTVRTHELGVVYQQDCDPEKWQGVLRE